MKGQQTGAKLEWASRAGEPASRTAYKWPPAWPSFSLNLQLRPAAGRGETFAAVAGEFSIIFSQFATSSSCASPAKHNRVSARQDHATGRRQPTPSARVLAGARGGRPERSRGTRRKSGESGQRARATPGPGALGRHRAAAGGSARRPPAWLASRPAGRTHAKPPLVGSSRDAPP